MENYYIEVKIHRTKVNKISREELIKEVAVKLVSSLPSDKLEKLFKINSFDPFEMNHQTTPEDFRRSEELKDQNVILFRGNIKL